jgi:N-acetylglucosamine kinase-like BadF-type ATPase
VLVVAGTGSVVCSRTPDGFVTTGGLGWVLSDHGSAARLGRAVLDRHCITPDAVVGEHLARVLGSAVPSQLARAVADAPAPQAALASAAPVLTAAAEDRREWAIDLLDSEMALLAATVAEHIQARGRPSTGLGLAGGVWTSHAATAAFARGLSAAGIRAGYTVLTTPPVRAALEIAREVADG